MKNSGAVLVGIDVLGVQRYVFSSIRLRDAISASWLVDWATNANGALAGLTKGRILLAGGANAILYFDDLQSAQKFIAEYTRKLYDVAPGLEVAVQFCTYQLGKLANALEQLRRNLALHKRQRKFLVPLAGLPVTASCQVTGRPASGFDSLEPDVPLSRMVLRWRDERIRWDADQRWNEFLPGQERERFAFPREIDDMGRTRGESSLVGVVHVDGNGVGLSILNWLERCKKENLPDSMVESQLRTWSTALDQAGQKALQAVVQRVIEAVEDEKIRGAVEDLDFELKRKDGKMLLPLRPVLLGGDDLTFLCDGRIALELAAKALETFVQEKIPDIPEFDRLSACAGVAIVPAHTPFERAYELAEMLCRNAKRKRRQENDSGCWIDWHIGAPCPGESVGALRERAYTASNFRLTCRPYRLDDDSFNLIWKSWNWLSKKVLGTEDDGFRGPLWSKHRNKVKELAAWVREGPEGVERARQAWTVAGRLPLPGGLREDGFLVHDPVRTPLLDAVELLDLYQPLPRRKDR